MCLKRVIIALALAIGVVAGIKCYKCYLAEHPYHFDESTQVQTCKNFEYSASYIVDCPESTFCYKKTVKDRFYNTDYVRVERGCARQLYKGQKFNSYFGWSEDSYVVSDAYRPGCKLVENHGVKSLEVEDCYCDNGDLCNASFVIKLNFKLLCLLLAIISSVIYYIPSFFTPQSPRYVHLNALRAGSHSNNS